MLFGDSWGKLLHEYFRGYGRFEFWNSNVPPKDSSSSYYYSKSNSRKNISRMQIAISSEGLGLCDNSLDNFG